MRLPSQAAGESGPRLPMAAQESSGDYPSAVRSALSGSEGTTAVSCVNPCLVHPGNRPEDTLGRVRVKGNLRSSARTQGRAPWQPGHGRLHRCKRCHDPYSLCRVGWIVPDTAHFVGPCSSMTDGPYRVPRALSAPRERAPRRFRGLARAHRERRLRQQDGARPSRGAVGASRLTAAIPPSIAAANEYARQCLRPRGSGPKYEVVLPIGRNPPVVASVDGSFDVDRSDAVSGRRLGHVGLTRQDDFVVRGPEIEHELTACRFLQLELRYPDAFPPTQIG
jgi:hypothetical protein